MSTKGPRDTGSSLLRQGDLGGGQAEAVESRPPGTAPVGRFADEGCDENPGASGAWATAAGEAEAATEDGFPGSEAVRRADAVDAGLFPGETARGALYDGPERRKAQLDWGRWEGSDRRERPFVYASQQRT